MFLVPEPLETVRTISSGEEGLGLGCRQFARVGLASVSFDGPEGMGGDVQGGVHMSNCHLVHRATTLRRVVGYQLILLLQ